MSLSSRDDVRRLYEDSADSYNKMMEQEIQLPMYHEVLGSLASKLDGVDGSIVDSSCGTGHMLERIRDGYESEGRHLIGVDLSPRMVELARQRLGDSATIHEGDMGSMDQLADASIACVISFFAIHHVDLDGLQRCLAEWNRVLVSGGHLVLAAWEGDGAVDYGGSSEVIARRYREDEVVHGVRAAGFKVVAHSVKPVDEIDMDVVHVFATKVREVA